MVRKQVYVVVLVAAIAAMTVALQAGARATLILTSGERVKGILVDMGGADFTMLEGGNEVRVPIGNVAVIDFVGGGEGIPATETSKMQGGRHLIFQRGGDSFLGRLTDVRGDNPLRMVFNTPDGELEMNAAEISRIYLRRWEGMPQGTGGGGDQTSTRQQQQQQQQGRRQQQDQGGVSVPANTVWINTGVEVRAGQMVAFNASGQILLSGDDRDTAGPAGAHDGRIAGRGAPMPGVAAGALVGKSGISMPFGIGNQTQALRMPSTGVLFLAVNDDNPRDNQGEFRVQITIVR